MRLFDLLIPVVLASAVIVDVDDPDDSEQLPNCALRPYNITVVKTDAQGRTCRAVISTYACYGSCRTSEVATLEFPYTKWKSAVCNFHKRTNRIAALDQCDQGADPSIRSHRYLEAESCSCRRCKRPYSTCGSVDK